MNVNYQNEDQDAQEAYRRYMRDRMVQHIFQSYNIPQPNMWKETTLVEIQRDFPNVKPPKFNATSHYYFVKYNRTTREYLHYHEPGLKCLFNHYTQTWMYQRSDNKIVEEEDLFSSYDESEEMVRQMHKKHEGEITISIVS